MLVNPHRINVSFDVLVSVDSEREKAAKRHRGSELALSDHQGMDWTLQYSLGYDENRIPFSEKTLENIKSELMDVMPSYIQLDRFEGEIKLNRRCIKKF